MQESKVQSSEQTIAAFFDKDPSVLPLYHRLEALLFELGGVERSVQKSQIKFSSGKGFAYVWLPIHKVRGRPEHYLVLSFSLDYHLENSRIVEAVEPVPGRWMHHLILSAPGELDEALKGWLASAKVAAQATKDPKMEEDTQ